MVVYGLFSCNFAGTMKNNERLKGAIIVALGAISYGILATIVKYCNQQGFHTATLTFLQYVIGAVFLMVYPFLSRGKEMTKIAVTPKSKIKLIAFGLSMGVTSSLYYLSIQFIPVSMGIILLMQCIWMSVLLETLILKTKVEAVKVMSTILVIGGTLLATNIIFESAAINWWGILLGLGAALSYTITLFASSHIELKIPGVLRSKYLVMGGLIATVIFWNTDIICGMNSFSLLKWGLILGVFGTIIPPLLFTKGIPMTGIGLGGIIAAIEIPVSISSAAFILHESVTGWQWLGVVIIICSVIVANLKSVRTA